MAGLNNDDYAEWLNETASQDCSDVSEIYILYSDENTETITDSGEICTWMEGTDAGEIADMDEIKFSGNNGGGDWYAIDSRVTTNLERTVNFAEVPLNIKRPTGS